MMNRVIHLFVGILVGGLLHAGVGKKTIIATKQGLQPISILHKNTQVLTFGSSDKADAAPAKKSRKHELMQELGLQYAPISRVMSERCDLVYTLVVEGVSWRGTAHTVAIKCSYDQFVFCPNRGEHGEWVAVWMLDKDVDQVCINFNEPAPIKKIKIPKRYVYRQPPALPDDAVTYHFEVPQYGMFFASELYIPLHNVAVPLVPWGMYLLSLGIQFGTRVALACFQAYCAERLDEAIKNSGVLDDLLGKMIAQQPIEKPQGCGNSQPEPAQINATPIATPVSPIVCEYPVPVEEGFLIYDQPIADGINNEIFLTCDQHGEGAPTVQGLVGEATYVGEKQKSIIYEKPGCSREGRAKDFERLVVGEIKTTTDAQGNPIRIGKTAEGVTVTETTCSNDGRPTLYLKIPGQLKMTKVRYGTK